MFLKKFKNIIVTFLLLISIIPINTFAYSDYIIASGENIGIQINSKGIMIVGLYSVDNISPGKEAGIKIGDRIIKVNDENVDSINSMVNKISASEDKSSIKLTYLRTNKEYDTILKLTKDKEGIYKTGLYVKDTINGVGTLTYIDPGTKMYGALGHEIIDKNTSFKIEIKDGKIFKSDVTEVRKSSDGTPGEKVARFYSDVVYGSIEKNTSSGIFGAYKDDIENKKLYKVARKEEVKLGNAKILTVLNENKVEEFDIEITKLNDNDSGIKNILFSIVDEDLIEVAGGVVQGMSGSPIIQGDKIIGAITHVVIDSPTKGYGIYITNMLEEMEK